MKKKVLIIGIILGFLLIGACGRSNLTIQKKESYTNLFNNQMDGIQADQLKQASESFYQGNYTRSLEIYNNILNDFIAGDNQEAIINTLFMISACLIKQEKYKESLDVLMTIGRRNSLMLDKSREKSYYQAFQLVEMGNLLIESKLSPSQEFTEGMLKHGFKTAYSFGNKFLIAKSCRNLGYFYLLNNKFEESEDYLSKAFSLASKSQNLNFIAQTSHLLGKLYIQKADYSSSMESLVMAYKFYQINNLFFQQATVLITMGELYEKVEDAENAFRNYRRAYEMIFKNSAMEERIKAQYIALLNNKMDALISENPSFKEYEFFSKTQSNEAIKF